LTSNSATAEGRDRRRRWRPAPLVGLSVANHAVIAVMLVANPASWPWALGLLVTNHLLLVAAVLWPRGSLLGPNWVRLPAPAAQRGELSLTFDDGPDPQLTPRVLDLLDRHRAKASFFCIGEKAKAFPELVKEIARRGHSVENHSNRHRHSFAFFGISRLRKEVEEAQTTLGSITGRYPEFFRAPAGFRNPFLAPILASLDLSYVSWTRRGFDAVSTDPARILRRLTQGLAAGDVLLMHDSAPIVLEVLPEVLRRLDALGLRSVSLASAFAAQRGMKGMA
jgi:peptidoglycan/xylan/chitin deacetylase (PgdA/CDA1 family)